MKDRSRFKRGVDRSGMDLPEGMTCGHCIHLPRCGTIYGRIPADEVCDWEPSRFHPAPESTK